ncbi:MAG: ACT domain-containing protein, partial [Polyangiales bacterium]
AREVAWLIAEHLTLYHVATRRDLDDPATISSFADTIRAAASAGGSPIDRLQKLYLLTVADLSTTSPTAMTSWKARMLDDLFLATSHHLASTARGEETADVALQRVRADSIAAYERLSDATDDGFIHRYLDGMPKSYLLAQSGEAVAAQAYVVARRGDAAAFVDRVPSRHPDVLELCIVADDRPGLLASIAAALAAHRLDIQTAHIFGRRDGERVEAVDLFSVRRAGRDDDEATAPLGDREIAKISEDLCGLVTGAVDPRALLRERRGGTKLRERPAPAVDTGVEIDDRASRRFTVVDVYAKDRPGLLFTVAQALHDLKLTIARSKIATEGARAADSFYVTEIDGSKVATPQRREEIKREVAGAIERLSREGIG